LLREAASPGTGNANDVDAPASRIVLHSDLENAAPLRSTLFDSHPEKPRAVSGDVHGLTRALP